MSLSQEKIVPILLALYAFFSILSLRGFPFPSSTFSCLETGKIPSELVITNKNFLQKINGSHSYGINGTKLRKKLCAIHPQYDLIGWDTITNFVETVPVTETEEDFLNSKNSATVFPDVHLGGSWEPRKCVPLHSIAIIVPYRNRPDHLRQFLLYIHTFLQVQEIRYRIFVVEQLNEKPFNRGMLLNIGFTEASKNPEKFPCFIFHDVDLLPENLQNIYACTKRPRHMSAVVNTLRYTLQYETLFGGAISILAEQFQRSNGFSNSYFGWGGEDDDFRKRLLYQNIETIRFDQDLSSYRMLSHLKEAPSEARMDRLKLVEANYLSDGLNTLQYSVVKYTRFQLYTLIQANF